MKYLRVGIVGFGIHSLWGEGISNSIKEIARNLETIDNVSVIIITNKMRKNEKVQARGNTTDIKLITPFTAHAHTLKYKINYFLFCLVLSFYLPILIRMYKINILHFHLWLNPFYVWFGIVSKFMNVPLIWTMYTPTALDRSIIPPKLILTIFTRVICVDNFCKRTLANYNASEKALCIPVPVDINKFTSQPKETIGEYRQKLNLPKSEILILYAGHFFRGRGIHTLLQSYDSVISKSSLLRSKSRLILASSGVDDASYFSEIRKYVKQRGLENNVMFLGYQTAIEELYAAVDVLVFPAYDLSYVISTPLTVLEAMSSGKTVIATKIGGVEEVITNGKNGFLVEPRDMVLLEKLLEELINTTDRDSLLQERAQETIINNYASNIVAKKILNLYLACLVHIA